MRPFDSKPRPNFIWCALAFIPLLLVAGWVFGDIGVVVVSVIGWLAYLWIEGGIPVRAPTDQDHMTKNPGRGS